jgi:hypothetical protein
MNRALRDAVAQLAGVSPDDLDVRKRWTDYRDDCEVFLLADGRRVKVTHHAIRLLDPPKDPFIEGVMALALAAHEAKKARERAS